MRVLLFSRVTLPDGVRGNAQYSRFFIRGLQEAGHTVQIAISSETVADKIQQWDAPALPEEHEMVRKLIKAKPPDLFVVNYSYLSPLLTHATSNTIKAVLAHDARHLRYERFLKMGVQSESSPWTEEQEREALSHAEVVIAIQPGEAAEFRRIAPHARTVVLPCCFPPVFLRLPEKPETCLFIGSDADHNFHGITWFIEKVWPRVIERCPGAKLNICGTICSRLTSQNLQPNVSTHGRVDDLMPHFSDNAVGIVPLLVGSGCKLKMIETMSKARPCVTTSIGAQGLDPGKGGYVIADTEDAFATELIRLFNDRKRLLLYANDAFEHATERFDPKRSHDELWDTLHALYRLDGENGEKTR